MKWGRRAESRGYHHGNLKEALVRAALELIAEVRPDVVFLDIEMPAMSGFEVLAQLSHAPMVVFVTAHDDRAIEAFEAHAVDYLLKPLRPERVLAAVEKIKSGGAHPRAMRECPNRGQG